MVHGSGMIVVTLHGGEPSHETSATAAEATGNLTQFSEELPPDILFVSFVAMGGHRVHNRTVFVHQLPVAEAQRTGLGPLPSLTRHRPLLPGLVSVTSVLLGRLLSFEHPENNWCIVRL